MKITKITKKELQETLMKMEELAKRKVSRQTRHYSLSETFLEDLNSFRKVLNQIEDKQVFHIIDQNSKAYKQKEKMNILFDSFSIVLLQSNHQYYIYCIAEYKLK